MFYITLPSKANHKLPLISNVITSRDAIVGVIISISGYVCWVC